MKGFSGRGLISDDIIQSVDFVLAVGFWRRGDCFISRDEQENLPLAAILGALFFGIFYYII